MATLLYQGHGSLRLDTDGGKVIYIDPYAGRGYDVPADLVLVTHQHYDHNKLGTYFTKPGMRYMAEFRRSERWTVPDSET